MREVEREWWCVYIGTHSLDVPAASERSLRDAVPNARHDTLEVDLYTCASERGGHYLERVVHIRTKSSYFERKRFSVYELTV